MRLLEILEMHPEKETVEKLHQNGGSEPANGDAIQLICYSKTNKRVQNKRRG